MSQKVETGMHARTHAHNRHTHTQNKHRHTHTKQTHAHARTQKQIDTKTNTHTHKTNTHAHKTQTHTRMSTYILHTYIHACIHTYTHTYTHTHTYTYIHIVESRLSDLRLSDILFYPTYLVGTLHFINSHSEGLNSTETALAYVEQQREVTATDVLLFRRWRDLAAKKRKEAQNQIPIANLLKNELFRLQIYVTLNTIFVWRFFRVFLMSDLLEGLTVIRTTIWWLQNLGRGCR
jgi:hypothetical protein